MPQARTGVTAAVRASVTFSVLTELSSGLRPARTPAVRGALLTEWSAWGVRAVVDAPDGSAPARARSFLAWVMGRAPREVGGVAVWRLGGSVQQP